MAVNQKGGNGLVAEYQCALVLSSLLEVKGVLVDQTQRSLQTDLDNAIQRVANELSPAQVHRALNQGSALGEYLYNCIIDDPVAIGIDVSSSRYFVSSASVATTGHSTNSGEPSDLVLELRGESVFVLPVSLKAYKGGTVSLGSKSARASLVRLFLAKDRATDSEFVNFFGSLGRSFIDLFEDFKRASTEFYASGAGQTFVDAYEARKGTRKVNNPLRRKELGDYFLATRGFKSEHKFAEMYVDLLEQGYLKIQGTEDASGQFVKELRFILGNPEMLSLNAIAGADGRVVEVHNSLSHPAYRQLNAVLRPGVRLNLQARPNSSIVNVELRRANEVSRDLSLAIWKDATIQYKLEAKE